MIAIINYGRGNLASVSNSLNFLGIENCITNQAADIEAADALILPGVGAFDDAMQNLVESGLVDCIKGEMAAGKPFLGICLGMQLLFEESEEGSEKGLGILKGKVRRFHFVDAARRGLKVPHMGWNQLAVRHADPLLSDGSEVYFVHSYYVLPEDKSSISAESDYGGKFTAAIHMDNIYATQFHPEKSGKVGLDILKRFSDM